jgi:nitric oxide reductase large subunit
MKETKRKLALVSAIIILILLIIIMAQIPAPAQSNMRKYKELQRSVEYPAWQAKQKQVRIYRAKTVILVKLNVLREAARILYQ